MARITVEDCLDHVDNRFDLVMLASRRARALRNYNTEALVDEENDKPTVIALREIAKGVMSHELLDSQEISPDDEEVNTDFSFSNLTGCSTWSISDYFPTIFNRIFSSQGRSPYKWSSREILDLLKTC